MQNCTAGSISGCRVCNTNGTGWINDDSQCSTNHTCQSGSCIYNETCPESAWRNTSDIYYGCDGNYRCQLIDQEYVSYSKNASGVCIASVNSKKTLKYNCFSCGESACVGDTYQNYYCSAGLCMTNTDYCSDCSCSCGNYNKTESQFCSDGIDNDCNGATDYQDKSCGVSVKGIQLSDLNPAENTNIEVLCSYSSNASGCIYASLDGQTCTFSRWTSVNSDASKASFSCYVGSAGSKSAFCSLKQGRCYILSPNSSSQTLQAKPSKCTAYINESSCSQDNDCDWCSKCSGSAYSPAEDMCVAVGKCSHSCNKDYCNAECAGTDDCKSYCSGGKYFFGKSCSDSCRCVYDYRDCSGSCGTCKEYSCTGNSCECIDKPNCCGNGVCETGENCENCADCRCKNTETCCGQICQNNPTCGNGQYACCQNGAYGCCSDGSAENSSNQNPPSSSKVSRQEAQSSIDKLEAALETTKKTGEVVTQAKELSSSAKTSLTNEQFDKAKELADEGYSVISKEEPVVNTQASIWILVVGLSIALAIILLMLFMMYRKK